jgi:hypothetical protein
VRSIFRSKSRSRQTISALPKYKRSLLEAWFNRRTYVSGSKQISRSESIQIGDWVRIEFGWSSGIDSIRFPNPANCMKNV